MSYHITPFQSKFTSKICHINITQFEAQHIVSPSLDTDLYTHTTIQQGKFAPFNSPKRDPLPRKLIKKLKTIVMSSSGPPPPSQGAWVQKATVAPKKAADPTVPRSTPMNEPAHSERQYGREDYARSSCSKGACDTNRSGHTDKGGSSYTYR